MEYCIIVGVIGVSVSNADGVLYFCGVTGVSVSNADGVLYYCGGDWCFSVEC